jgi:hypothetical protein
MTAKIDTKESVSSAFIQKICSLDRKKPKNTSMGRAGKNPE